MFYGIAGAYEPSSQAPGYIELLYPMFQKFKQICMLYSLLTLRTTCTFCVFVLIVNYIHTRGCENVNIPHKNCKIIKLPQAIMVAGSD